MIAPRLFLCSGAPAPAGSDNSERKVKLLDTVGQEANVHLRIDNVTRAFESSLTDRVVDLLEIAAYVYTADCAAGREGAWLDKQSTEQWGRDLKLAVAVRDIEFWKRSDIATDLTKAVNFMTSDRFSFDFTKVTRNIPLPTYLGITPVDETPFYGIDRVTLFSGGLDSLAGVAQAAAAGKTLALVSHRPVSQTDIRQADLVKSLRDKFKVPIHHNPVWVNKRSLDAESTQRSRVFLFACLAGAVASVLKAQGIQFYENGVISLNWRLADEVLQSRASRTTHPETLYFLEVLLRKVLNAPEFVVENPFILKTKTEVVSALASARCDDLIGKSCSCVKTLHKPRGYSHCGRCGQCIDRRVAVIAAGQVDNDPAGNYAVDVFTGDRPYNPERPYEHNIAAHYARYAREISKMDEFRIAELYNKDLGRAARRSSEPLVLASDLVYMQQRHAASVMQVLTEQLAQNSPAIAQGSLAPTSLLAMVAKDDLTFKTPSPPTPPVTAPAPMSGAATSSVTVNPNEFRRYSETWTLTYRQKSTSLVNVLGLAYLCTLLQNPGKRFSCVELVSLSEPTRAKVATTATVMSSVEAEESSLSGAENSSRDQALGEGNAYANDLRNELQAALKKLNAAKTYGTPDEQVSAQQDVNKLRRLTNGSVGRNGKSRNLSPAMENLRTSVRSAITTVYKKLDSSLPELAMHLRSSVRTGKSCIYAPSEKIFWET